MENLFWTKCNIVSCTANESGFYAVLPYDMYWNTNWMDWNWHYIQFLQMQSCTLRKGTNKRKARINERQKYRKMYISSSNYNWDSPFCSYRFWSQFTFPFFQHRRLPFSHFFFSFSFLSFFLHVKLETLYRISVPFQLKIG